MTCPLSDAIFGGTNPANALPFTVHSTVFVTASGPTTNDVSANTPPPLLTDSRTVRSRATPQMEKRPWSSRLTVCVSCCDVDPSFSHAATMRVSRGNDCDGSRSRRRPINTDDRAPDSTLEHSSLSASLTLGSVGWMSRASLGAMTTSRDITRG